jgi:hypothetical protein
VRVVSQQFFPRGALVAPHAGDQLRQHDRVAVAYAVLDTGGRPLVELPHYVLSLEMTIARPDGARADVVMERVPQQPALVFRAAHETEWDVPGRYWTDVRITAVDDAGRRLDVFRDRWSGFTVARVPRLTRGSVAGRPAIVWIIALGTGGGLLLMGLLSRRTTKS